MGSEYVSLLSVCVYMCTDYLIKLIYIEHSELAISKLGLSSKIQFIQYYLKIPKKYYGYDEVFQPNLLEKGIL